MHADIRPGYDFTSNILLRLDEEDESEMVLIDLDSLSSFAALPAIDFPGYLSKENLNPYSYVWWQCFAVAVMWKRESHQEVGCAALQNKFDWELDESECDADAVETLLTKVMESDWFDVGNDLTDQRVTQILAGTLLPVDDIDETT